MCVCVCVWHQASTVITFVKQSLMIQNPLKCFLSST